MSERIFDQICDGNSQGVEIRLYDNLGAIGLLDMKPIRQPLSPSELGDNEFYDANNIDREGIESGTRSGSGKLQQFSDDPIETAKCHDQLIHTHPCS